MADITPGYNFGTYEQVNAAKLKTFIEDATVSDISWSEVDPSIPRFAVVNSTTFSLGPEGTIWWEGVTRSLRVQSRWGPVAVWRAWGMETRRLKANTSGFPAIRPWAFLGVDSSGDPESGVSWPAFEIRTGTNNTNLGQKVIGVLQDETAVTAVRGRILLAPCITKVEFASWAETDDVGEVGGSGNADGDFIIAANQVATDKITGCVLGNAEDDAAGASTTGYIFCIPEVWRA